jgi:hypothetical protein
VADTITVHRFVDPISGQELVLRLDGDPGVEHPGCHTRADVVADLDAFYCAACGRNGRIGGAWYLHLLENQAAGGHTAQLDHEHGVWCCTAHEARLGDTF